MDYSLTEGRAPNPTTPVRGRVQAVLGGCVFIALGLQTLHSPDEL